MEINLDSSLFLQRDKKRLKTILANCIYYITNLLVYKPWLLNNVNIKTFFSIIINLNPILLLWNIEFK